MTTRVRIDQEWFDDDTAWFRGTCRPCAAVHAVYGHTLLVLTHIDQFVTTHRPHENGTAA